MARVAFQKTHFLVKGWAVPEIFGKGPLANAIRSQSKLSKKMYKTPLPALNPHFAHNFRMKHEKSPNLRTTRTVVDLSDGGILGIDKMELPDSTSQGSVSNKPIVLVFPGGSVTTYSPKAQTLCMSYLTAGYSDVYMCNYRGKCNTPLLTPRLSFPIGEYNDLSAVVTHVSEKFPDRPILIVGDCFGSRFAIDYLTRDDNVIDSNVVGGVFHSIQWNSDTAVPLSLTEPLYSRYWKPWGRFNKDLLVKGQGKKGNKEFVQQVYEKIGSDGFNTLSSLSMEQSSDMDLLYLAGFSKLVDGAFTDYKDYFDKTSPHLKIKNLSLSRPLIVINADDDPMAPISLEDIADIEKDPKLCLWFFSAGGHGSYVSRLFPCDNFINATMVECSDILISNLGE